MSQTVVALYDNFPTARRVVEDLVEAGFPRDTISLIANDASGEYAGYLDADSEDVSAGEGAGFGAVVGALVGLGVALIPGVGPVLAAGPFAAAAIGALTGAATGGIAAALMDLGVPEVESEYYLEGIRRGGTLVTVTADESNVNRAQDIMNRYNPIDLEQRSGMWRESGWTGYNASAQPMSYDQIKADRTNYTTLPAGQEEHLNVVEEELHIGKREVEGTGGVRVSKYVTAQPVEEQVRLREEHVRVERRPVDRPATESDFNAFSEGVIEVTERREEPVIQKTARVVEEIVVGKDVEEHTQTVRDTVRRTDVEVEPMTGTTTHYRTYESFEPGWRTHYSANFANSGYSYDQFSPAYRYGYSLATNPNYSGWDWDRLEPEAHRYWEERNPSTWDQFKNAIRQAWWDVRDTLDI